MVITVVTMVFVKWLNGEIALSLVSSLENYRKFQTSDVLARFEPVKNLNSHSFELSFAVH